ALGGRIFGVAKAHSIAIVAVRVTVSLALAIGASTNCAGRTPSLIDPVAATLKVESPSGVGTTLCYSLLILACVPRRIAQTARAAPTRLTNMSAIEFACVA